MVGKIPSGEFFVDFIIILKEITNKVITGI